MALSAGTRLGPYEILEPLGAGGMGEVYRARDTRLDRTVALKVLPAELAADPQLKARFEREARAISALAHPNICTLHDVGEEDGRTFLVMEHLVGHTLAERLKKGPLPLEQALEVAAQIADALAVAHRQGIIHRDLKPANVMLTRTGACLLDFGLARLSGHGGQPAVESLTSAPTEPPPLTGRGTIMGTLPYMAPEQIEGKPADARTDLWALGAVLYEMLTGERAFQASSPVSLVGAILEREPAPLKERQPLTPPSLERLVRRCLAKDPDDRWDTAHDVADELRWVAESAAGPGPDRSRRPGRRMVILSVASLVASGLLGAAVVGILKSTSPPQVVRSLLDVRPAEEVNSGGGEPTEVLTAGGSRMALDWTPDGRSLVFIGRIGDVQRLYVRALGEDEAHPLDGTEGAGALAVSPDGLSVAFCAAGEIRKVALSGGPVGVLVRDVDGPGGLIWGDDGRLFYDGYQEPLWAAEPGQDPVRLTTLREDELQHRLPHLLPDGRTLLYTVRGQNIAWGDEEVVAQVLATGERKPLLDDAADARYVASGHLVFLRRGVLHAVGFDAARLEVRGTPEPVLENVAQALTAGNWTDITGAGHFSVAPNGTLAYIRSPVRPYPDSRLVVIDRQGHVSPLPAPPRPYASDVELSPDGGSLAVAIRNLAEQMLWIYDLQRGTLSRFTTGREVGNPRWTPDGQHLAFWSLREGVERIVWQRADGTTAPDVLVPPPDGLVPQRSRPSSWSPDGHRLAFTRDGDIWTAAHDGSSAATPFWKSAENEGHPEFSPDGRWLAYGSNASGRAEVYVQPYPGPGPRQMVSLDGGFSPAWSPTGRELFFLSELGADGTTSMMMVDVRPGPVLTLSRPRRLFAFDNTRLRITCGPIRCYEVAPDAQSFYGVQTTPSPPTPPVTHIHLVLNWLEEVKARVPTD